MAENIVNVKDILKKNGIVLAFLIICILLSFLSPYFMDWGNWTNILRQASINGILAIGMTYVILTGGIDLSVGSILACSGIVTGSLVTGNSDMSIPLAIACGIGVGTALGSINGLLISRFSVPPFVATLGMLSAARGLTKIYNDGKPYSGFIPEFKFIGQGHILNIPIPVIVLIIAIIVFGFILKYTIFGRYIYAVGGNIRSAKTSGIRTRTVIFSTYLISGALAGLAGVLLTARTTAAVPQAGESYELDAIAAVVIGGTSLKGGRGSLIGTVFGVLIISVINNGLDLMGVSSYYQQVVKGLIIVVAVLLDGTRKESN
ncbi:ABC transporter permease [Thorsellia anophelis]|uniref:Putative xylitol transport system permease protein n=1 Tax=Thorsellia anophelis DSM 18579 TaxID=1123402 RepID=A0A1I0AEI1_9GAMM|nr:ABC transporter permease [Thorsellia anophelis]SES92213.1 putative xylitol transport system permease protein [Thorsellia anophelis DSM 18579]